MKVFFDHYCSELVMIKVFHVHFIKNTVAIGLKIGRA